MRGSLLGDTDAKNYSMENSLEHTRLGLQTGPECLSEPYSSSGWIASKSNAVKDAKDGRTEREMLRRAVAKRQEREERIAKTRYLRERRGSTLSAGSKRLLS